MGRATLEQTVAGLRIVIPAYRHLYNFWAAVVIRPVLGLFLVAMMWRIFADSPVFMGFATITVVFAVTTTWAWKGLGSEIIPVNTLAFTIRREIAAVRSNPND